PDIYHDNSVDLFRSLTGNVVTLSNEWRTSRQAPYIPTEYGQRKPSKRGTPYYNRAGSTDLPCGPVCGHGILLEQLPWIKVRGGVIYNHAHISNHHFFPGLLTIKDVLAGVRIVSVAGGVIVVRLHSQFRALGHVNRRVILQLPIEIVTRHVQDCFLFPVRIGESVGHRFPTNMHVRHHGEDFYVSRERGFSSRSGPVPIICGNAETLPII